MGMNTGPREAADEDGQMAALDRLGEDLTRERMRLTDAARMLPGLMLGLAAVGLVGFAMINPAAFALRMEGLARIPGQLWWLLGGTFGLHVSLREVRHARARALMDALAASIGYQPSGAGPVSGTDQPASQSRPAPSEFPDNAALRDWAALRG